MASRSSTQTAASLPPRSLEFERECVRFFEEVVQVFGVPKSVGQIYGLLYASPLPLSFSDIVEQLEISKGSASQGLQLLRSLGAINVAEATVDGRQSTVDGRVKASPRDGGRSGVPLALGALRFAGDATALPLAPDAPRREYFEPELSLRRLVSGVLQERIAPMAATSAERLARLRELAEQENGEDEFYLDRAKQLSTWRRRLKTVLPVLGALLGPRGRGAKSRGQRVEGDRP